MNAIVIANVDYCKNEGIVKKVFAEASALNDLFGQCYLIMKNNKNSVVVDMVTQQKTNKRSSVIEAAKSILRNKKTSIVYVRIMIPSISLILLMRMAKSMNAKVYYEIPTYPYYKEQFRASNNKIRTSVRLLIDYTVSPILYYYCDRIAVIKSNTKTPLKPKMIEIHNGVSNVDLIEKQNYPIDHNKFKMVTIGTLYNYHGYDRILKGLYQCKESVRDINIELHVIGESTTIEELKTLSEKLCLKRVFFHGEKSTKELNEMFNEYDIGLGCLALHRRNANIDTTLKLLEYYRRGIPAVTSGISPMDSFLPRVTIHVHDGEDPINIELLVDKYVQITADDKNRMISIAKKEFDWNIIMKDLIETK